MNLSELVVAADYRISGGAPYTWNSFGEHARYIELGEEGSGKIASAIFDAKNQRVYCVEVFNEYEDIAWRWIDSEYIKPFISECKKHTVNPDIAYDDVKFLQVDEAEILITVNEVLGL